MLNFLGNSNSSINKDNGGLNKIMREIIKTRFEFDETKLAKRNTDIINIIILHHRAGDGDVKSIHEQHKKRGFAGIGYNYYIRKSGDIFKGRPIEFIGSHCSGSNKRSIGICLEGNFTKEEPTQEQFDALVELVIQLKERYPNIVKILNHSDLVKTLCPATEILKLHLVNELGGLI